MIKKRELIFASIAISALFLVLISSNYLWDDFKVEIPSAMASSYENKLVPYFDEGSIYINVEDLSDTINANFTQVNDDLYSISLNNIDLSFSINTDKAMLNGKDINLDYRAIKKDNNIFLPCEFLKYYLSLDYKLLDDNLIELSSISQIQPIFAKKTISKNTDEYYYIVDIPIVFNLADSAYEQKLNNELEDKVYKYINSFVLDAKESNSSKYKKYSLEYKVKTTFTSSSLISFYKDINLYDGAYKSKNIYEASTIDINSQRFLSLDELFINDDYGKYIHENLENSAENLLSHTIDGFYIENDYLVIYYQEGRLTNAFEGVKTFKVLLSDIKEQLKTNYRDIL